MTEDLEEGNLVFKTEAFLSYVVLSSWRDSIVVLKSCENLSPWAENLQIVRRCSESIAWKACANPKGIRWQYTGKPRSSSSPSRSAPVPPDWWFEDVSILRIDHFVRVVTAIRVKGMVPELIGAAIIHYASKWLPSLVKDGAASVTSPEDEPYSISSGTWKGGLHVIVAGNQEILATVQAKDQRMIVESLVSIIPQQRDCVSCSFLLRLLRMANMLNVAPALVTELEKRVGMQLEQATLSDLLIPCYNTKETIYDVDLVQRLLEHFLVQEQSSPMRPDTKTYDYAQRGSNNLNAKMRVARLVDSYLTEVARDRNLSLTKFQVLAEALPESARSCDDGLYRAVDSYLKAHPTLTEHERKRLCRVMECQKLSVDACMHAAQNERLPLRVVVQVLFSEQVKISNAVALKEGGESQYQPMVPNRKTLLEGTPQSFQEGWTTAKKDINTLKFDLETVKTKYLELQNDMETLQRDFNKLAKPKQTSAWTSGWKRLSKLTKMTDANDNGIQLPTAEHTRKTPRRWRNSIS
ncbi:root phototropism protein 3-like isoform X2 [Salvia splendens]|nr:root phototropism protein 3-like isoform X2 [Salvia splendens]